MGPESGQTSAVRTIGRYRTFDELGRGAMGVVYRGFDPVIGRTVALKTLLLDSGDPEAREFKERLYREAAAAGALSHPNIVTIFDIVEDGNTTAVAMEFIEGRSLAAIIAERAPLPFDLAVEIIEQVCSALDYAGAAGIVHRDIKPANILMTSAGRAKITDFGVARLALSTMTQAGTILGSPSYMSPEQVRGLPLDGRSDLFSAAVVFYEMITRERPFAGNDVATTMFRIAHEPPTPPNTFNAAIGPMVTAALERAFAKNPNERFATGAEFVAQLRRAANMEAGAVAGPSIGLSAVAAPPPPPVPLIVVPEPPGTVAMTGLQPPGTVAMTGLQAPGASGSGGGPAQPLPAIVTPGTPVPGSLAPLPGTAAPGQGSGALAALPPGASIQAGAGAARRTGVPARTLVIGGAAAVVTVVLIVVVALQFVGGRPSTDAGPAGEPSRPPVTAAPASAPVQQAEPAAAPAPPPVSTVPPPTPASTPGAQPAGRAGASSARPPARPANRAATPQAAAPTAAAPAARTGSGDRVYDVTEVDEKPTTLREVPPSVPEGIPRFRAPEVVVLRVLVTPNGRPGEIRLLRKSAITPALDGAAIAAARQYVFSPAKKGGQAVPCWFNMGVVFQPPK